MTCTRCHAVNSGIALFCHSCGHPLRVNEEVECENHSGTTATGICIVCGKPVCDDCSLSREGKVYCDDVGHSQLMATYTRLAFSPNEFEAEIIAKNLIPNGIPVLLFSAKLFSQFCRLTDERRISIFVSAGKSDEAKRLLLESELAEFLSDEHNSP